MEARAEALDLVVEPCACMVTWTEAQSDMEWEDLAYKCFGADEPHVADALHWKALLDLPDEVFKAALIIQTEVDGDYPICFANSISTARLVFRSVNA